MAFFQKLGIPGPVRVAYGETRRWCGFNQGAIVMEEIKGVKDLETIALDYPTQLQDKDWLWQVVRTVASYTRLLHQHQFIHVDLKWRNILVEATQSPKVYFIDCPVGKKVTKFFLGAWSSERLGMPR